MPSIDAFHFSIPRHRISEIAGPISGAMVILTALLAGLWLWHERNKALEAGEKSASVLVQVLKEQTARAFEAVDLTLRGIVDVVQMNPSIEEHHAPFEEALRDRLKSLPQVRTLLVIGPDGFIVQDSSHPATPRLNLADRDYFRAHADNPTSGSRVARPMSSRTTGRPFVAVSHRIAHLDGSFGGVAVAVVEPVYFERFYRQIDAGPNVSIGLYRHDGVLLARFPHRANLVGGNFSQMEVFRRHLPTAPDGTFRVVSALDNVPRIVSYRTVGEFPLLVAVALAETDVLAGWRRNAIVTGVALAFVVLLTALLIIAGLRHIAERRQAYQRHSQIEKLEALGRMTGGVAHDFNNLMAIVSGGLEFILRRSDRADVRKMAETASGAVERGTKLTQQMLAFARRQELVIAPADVNELIAQIDTLLRNAAGPGIELAVEYGDNVPQCLTDPTQFDTALLNLVVNARDAMPSRGTLRITTSRCADDDVRRTATLKPGAYACVTVTDSGHGMTPAVLHRALEPFFSTKGDKGTGLGLSQVYGFLRQVGGDMSIQSEPGRGTTVSLFFPGIEPEGTLR